MFLSGGQQNPCGKKIDRRGNDRHREPYSDVGQRLRIEQAVYGRYADGHGGKEDQKSFEATGEVLGFAVAVSVLVVSRLFDDVMGFSPLFISRKHPVP